MSLDVLLMRPLGCHTLGVAFLVISNVPSAFRTVTHVVNKG